MRHAVEFRSEAWYVPAVCDAHGAAFCEHDLVRAAPDGGLRYLRFHGASGKYRGR